MFYRVRLPGLLGRRPTLGSWPGGVCRYLRRPRLQDAEGAALFQLESGDGPRRFAFCAEQAVPARAPQIAALRLFQAEAAGRQS